MLVRGDRCFSLAERFIEKLDLNGPVHPALGSRCWVWMGAKIEKGHGVIGRGGRGNGRLMAHRVAFALAYPSEVLGEGDVICHACDNPPCCRPSHLFKGTQRDNIHDMLAKGRGRWSVRPKPTHCRRGHPFDESNTYIDKRKGYRQCKKCHAAAIKTLRQMRKQASQQDVGG